MGEKGGYLLLTAQGEDGRAGKAPRVIERLRVQVAIS